MPIVIAHQLCRPMLCFYQFTLRYGMKEMPASSPRRRSSRSPRDVRTGRSSCRVDVPGIGFRQSREGMAVDADEIRSFVSGAATSNPVGDTHSSASPKNGAGKIIERELRATARNATTNAEAESPPLRGTQAPQQSGSFLASPDRSAEPAGPAPAAGHEARPSACDRSIICAGSGARSRRIASVHPEKADVPWAVRSAWHSAARRRRPRPIREASPHPMCR